MGIFDHLAKFAGESVRIYSNKKKEEALDPQTKQWLNELVQQAQNGNTHAMFELGGHYFNGTYVGYDPNKACFWWTEAANRGNINAQYNLGLLYHGEISTYYYDENLAGYWFNIAAQNGDQESYNFLRKYYKYNNLIQKWKRTN